MAAYTQEPRPARHRTVALFNEIATAVAAELYRGDRYPTDTTSPVDGILTWEDSAGHLFAERLKADGDTVTHIRLISSDHNTVALRTWEPCSTCEPDRCER
jgi:hypothetical protein